MRVLDPACGSGNFLYVTLEHLKRLEGEVFDTLDGLGERAGLELEGGTVDPAPAARPRDQSPRRGHRRDCALDRLSAMALPHPRQRPRRQPIIETSTTSNAATP